MNVIFLDVDGVLNSYARGGTMALSKTKIKKLRDIVWCGNAKIVVSSSWRLFPEARAKLVRYLKYKGLTVYGWTLDMGEPYSRGDEISMWLDTEGRDVEKYVILDDMDETQFEEHIYNLVQTDSNEGLTDKDVLLALDILLHGDEV